MSKETVHSRFKDLELLISVYAEDCISDGPDADRIYDLTECALENLAQMAVESTNICPCCGEDAGELQEASSGESEPTVYGQVLLEHDTEAKAGRATLYLVDDPDTIGDWIEEETNEVAPEEVIRCLRNLLEKLELKYGGAG